MINRGKTMETLVYKPRELFKLLGVPKNTGYELLRSGEIKSVRAGRSFLIPRKAMEDFLAGEDREDD
jgi:excisionase family DNA binding protein